MMLQGRARRSLRERFGGMRTSDSNDGGSSWEDAAAEGGARGDDLSDMQRSPPVRLGAIQPFFMVVTLP